jgi:membrane protein
MGASLSYFAIFSMAPLFIILITIASIFLSSEIAETKLLAQIGDMVGSNITEYIAELISMSDIGGGTTIIAGLIGFGTLIFGTLGVFRELSYSIDKIWTTDPEKKPKRLKGLKQIMLKIKNHLPMLLLVLVLALLFGISIFSSIILQVTGDYFRSIFPNAFGLIQFLEPIVSFLFVALFFGAIYRVLPKTKLPMSEIAFGASVTAIVFLIGELLIGTYLGHFINNSAFGAAGSLISIMLWVYFSAQVFFLGASFTFVFSKRYGYLNSKA